MTQKSAFMKYAVVMVLAAISAMTLKGMRSGLTVKQTSPTTIAASAYYYEASKKAQITPRSLTPIGEQGEGIGF